MSNAAAAHVIPEERPCDFYASIVGSKPSTTVYPPSPPATPSASSPVPPAPLPPPVQDIQIPPTNRGYRLLQCLGFDPTGTGGLGRNLDGRREPVPVLRTNGAGVGGRVTKVRMNYNGGGEAESNRVSENKKKASKATKKKAKKTMSDREARAMLRTDLSDKDEVLYTQLGLH